MRALMIKSTHGQQHSPVRRKRSRYMAAHLHELSGLAYLSLCCFHTYMHVCIHQLFPLFLLLFCFILLELMPHVPLNPNVCSSSTPTEAINELTGESSNITAVIIYKLAVCIIGERSQLCKLPSIPHQHQHHPHPPH
uniref:Uncharacterized protein n=1 Tax=Echinococcus canadensis TaxID=519352 RepID=A0A915F0S0_9CEST